MYTRRPLLAGSDFSKKKGPPSTVHTRRKHSFPGPLPVWELIYPKKFPDELTVYIVRTHRPITFIGERSDQGDIFGKSTHFFSCSVSLYIVECLLRRFQLCRD